jgi:hypothetical protein
MYPSQWPMMFARERLCVTRVGLEAALTTVISPPFCSISSIGP